MTARPGIALVLLSMSACMPYQVPEVPAPGSRMRVSEDDVRALVPGKTRLQDVLLRLGEPERAPANEAQFEYEWVHKPRATVWAFSAVDGVIQSNSRLLEHQRLVIRFDASGVIRRVTLFADDRVVHEVPEEGK